MRKPGIYITAFFAISCLLFLETGCSSPSSFSKKDIRRSQKLIGLDFNRKDIRVMHSYLERNLAGYDSMRTHKLSDDVLPAILFDPHPDNYSWPLEGEDCTWTDDVNVRMPDDVEQLAFASVSELANLIKSRQVTSVALTKMYLQRIKKYDPLLKCVVTLLEDRALQQALQADQEIDEGEYRGPLHGIPYGLKDLAAVEGYPTTWGARPYKNQVINETATIVHKLEEAGAVLLAKLTSGSLARGDVWFDGQTLSPWDTLQGASGSSAGSASATAAGLVAFSIGTETLGSITSPSNRNGVTGLRPSYGRVSRHGFMPLSWSMDKVGPICRSAADCAIVFRAIQGLDKKDRTTVDLSFCFLPIDRATGFRIGYLEKLVEEDTTSAGEKLTEAAEVFRTLGFKLQPDSLPGEHPFAVFDIILRAEAGAFFDDFVRDKRVDQMVQQDRRSRANSLRQSRFIPAVEYIQANRHRRILINDLHEFMGKYDAVITPTFGGTQLLTTNLTGHPVITIPMGLDAKGHPTSLTIIGNLYEEQKILQVAKFFQDHTDHHLAIPPLFAVPIPED